MLIEQKKAKLWKAKEDVVNEESLLFEVDDDDGDDMMTTMTMIVCSIMQNKLMLNISKMLQLHYFTFCAYCDIQIIHFKYIFFTFINFKH